MGVPRLFPWIVKNFGRYVFRLTSTCRVSQRAGVKIDNLYLDDNGLLHSAAQEIYNYGTNARKMSPYKGLSELELRLKCYELFLNMTRDVVKMVGPRKRLYIAIDGPAPLAKQGQQRERRFCAGLATPTATAETKFSSTQISPGTEFEFELTRFLHTKIRELMSPGQEWHHLEVIFSPPTSPGEGEHSCLDHMRKYTSDDDKNCIFGPDGDLIMLALSSHRKNIFLLRQDQYVPGYYDLLDFGGIRKELGSKLFLSAKYETKRCLDDVSDDFVLIGFFVGNDFLPKIQMFMYLEDGLELMISTYANISKRGTANFLTTDGKINHGPFLRFIEELARREGIYILDQHNQEPPDPRFKNRTLDAHVTVNEDGTKKLSFQSYREAYYGKSGMVFTDGGGSDAGGEDPAEIRQMCLDYLRMITWVFRYYTKELPSWHDYYSWHYAPLMGDLADVMASLSKEERRYIYEFEDRGRPSLPFVQLLCILPPSSSHLLPSEYGVLMTSTKSKLVKSGMYPKKFAIDYEGKTKEHMGVALLPYVDIDLVWKVYDKVEAKKRYTRNRLSKVERFVVTKKSTSYTSKYGDIEKNYVVKSYLD